MNETTWNEYKFTRLSIERFNDLATLYQAVYGRAVTQKHFQLKYATAFTGVMYTGYLAYDKQNRPAAFFGAIPCFINYGADKLLAAQAVDAMTHPLHRGKGLFIKLANLTVTVCQEVGVRILFGFPNQHSLPGLVSKLHWNLAGQMACFTLPVKTVPLEALAMKFPILKRVYKWYVNRQLNKYRLPEKWLMQSSAGAGFTSVCRDEDHLEYKSYTESVMVTIQEATVWLKAKNGLVVGDMTIPENFDATIHNLKKLARKLGLRQVMFQISEGIPLYNLLVSIAKPAPGFPVIIKDLGSGLPVDKLKFTFADIDIF